MSYHDPWASITRKQASEHIGKKVLWCGVTYKIVGIEGGKSAGWNFKLSADGHIPICVSASHWTLCNLNRCTKEP